MRGRKGFTLIELLVVIAIIGILAALIINSLAAARQRATDTQTKNNVRSLSSALEQYYTDKNIYPFTLGVVPFNNGVLTNALGPFVTGGASSAVFTGYGSVGTSTAYGTFVGSPGYVAAATLTNITEAANPEPNGILANEKGNGEYRNVLTLGQFKFVVGPPGNTATVTLSGLTMPDGTAAVSTTRAWVVYGPQ